MILELASISSPIGMITVAAFEGALCALDFGDLNERTCAHLTRRFGAIEFRPAQDRANAATRLAAYFAGELDALKGIAADTGGSPFQRAVWNELRAIPVGAVISYGELARRIGAPAAVRAVGAANGANPVGIVIPCHRVIGANGKLVGYGGGIERKRWLLAHEGAQLPLLAANDRSFAAAPR